MEQRIASLIERYGQETVLEIVEAVLDHCMEFRTIIMRSRVVYSDGDREHVGYYTVDNGMVTVRYGDSSKSTQVGGSTPAVLARLLLRELVGAAR
jgi:hypothetical protein